VRVALDDTATTSSLKSLDCGLQLVLRLRDQASLSVSEAARSLGVAPSTAHRLLATLKARGFVTQDLPSRRYRAGTALLDVALSALRNLDVRRSARLHLESLAEEVRETVDLIMLGPPGPAGPSMRFVDVVEGPERLRVASRLGEARPAHCTAGGKVLLAWLPSQQLERLYPEEELPGLTARSLTSREELWEELAMVRARGFATNAGESIEGLSAVAVPIRDPAGAVAAALAVSAPSSRLSPRRSEKVAEAALRAAAAIETSLRAGQA
jgi:DNA-binding IclR family transcriptional regulator